MARLEPGPYVFMGDIPLQWLVSVNMSFPLEFI